MKSLLLTAAVVAADDIILHGSGTTNPSKFYWDIMSKFEARAKPPVKMTYRAVGSGTGLREFVGADQNFTAYSDFGSGDIPVDATNYEELQAEGIEILHVPFNLGAMSFFYNAEGAPAAGIKFDACVLADIFSRVITVWDHPDIIALNPALDLPAGQEIKVFHRVLGSSTTAGITTYLNKACPDRWPASKVGSSITWPEGTFEADGSGLMSDAIQATPYSIGYVDSGHGHDNGLVEIELQNLAGTFQTSKVAIAAGGVQAAAEEALSLGIVPSDPSADFSEVLLHNMPGPDTWPIVAISYIWVRKDQTKNVSKGPLLVAFLEYILSAAGQALLPTYGFEGLPQDILNVSEAALAAIQLPVGMPTWTFETDTLAGAGQADYVISSKRRSWAEYELEELIVEKAEVSVVDALEAKITALEALVPVTLDGSGTTNPSKYYWDIMSLFETRAKPGVKMSYRAVGSGTGLHEFVGEDQFFEPYADFGSGDIPVTAASYSALQAEDIEILHVPFNLGAMSFFYHVDGAPAAGIKFDACVLADVFNRVITVWDHVDIKALNPDLSVPAGQEIKVFHRVLGSSTTAGITTYLNKACPDRWPASKVGSSITWPEGTFEADGSGLMSDAIQATPYSIGYVDSGHGHDNGLVEIELANLAGTFQTSKVAIAAGGVQAAADAGIAAGIVPSDPSADFSEVILHNQAGPDTWPIVAISYIWVRKDQTMKGRTAGLLHAFLSYIISTEGQALIPKYGFEPVPATIRDVAQAAIAELDMPADFVPWTFETSTLAGAGQKNYVISSKRRSYNEYAISEIIDEKAEKADVMATEAALEASITAVGARVVALEQDDHADADHHHHDDDDDVDEAKDDATNALGIAAAALVIAFLALCCAAYAAVKVSTARGAPGGIEEKREVCIPAVKPSTQAYADLTLQTNDQL